MNGTSRSNSLVDRVTPWLIPVATLVLWEAASRSGLIEQRIMPAPSQVAMRSGKTPRAARCRIMF